MKTFSQIKADTGAARNHRQVRDAENLDECIAWMDELDASTSPVLFPSPFVDVEVLYARRINLRNNVRSGKAKAIPVACDHCGTQLVNRHPGVQTASKPPKIRVGCPGCGWLGHLNADYHLFTE